MCENISADKDHSYIVLYKSYDLLTNGIFNINLKYISQFLILVRTFYNYFGSIFFFISMTFHEKLISK